MTQKYTKIVSNGHAFYVHQECIEILEIKGKVFSEMPDLMQMLFADFVIDIDTDTFVKKRYSLEQLMGMI